MTTFRRVPEIPDPELEQQPLSVCQVADDGTETYDRDCKEGSPLWAAYQAWLALGNTLDAPIATLADVTARLSTTIDGAVAAIYLAWTRFQVEYDARLSAAKAWAASGYTAAVSPWITSFSSSAGIENVAACDLIIRQGQQLDTALAALGALRMRKYEILNAPDADTATSIYSEIMSGVAAIEAQLESV